MLRHSATSAKIVSNVMLVPTDADQLSVGADFNSLKVYLRCPASAPASTR